MALLSFLVRRLLMMIPVLLGMSIIVFSLIHLVPGDPARVMLGLTATPENIHTLREQMGLDDPLWKQYIHWLWNLLQGDLGMSLRTGHPVPAGAIPWIVMTSQRFYNIRVLYLGFG